MYSLVMWGIVLGPLALVAMLAVRVKWNFLGILPFYMFLALGFLLLTNPEPIPRWKNSYWLHDMRTGDVISSDPATDDIHDAIHPIVDRDFAPNLTVAQTEGDCSYAVGDVIHPNVFGWGFSMRFIGRATKPDYRYLLEWNTQESFDRNCVKKVLVDPSTLRLIKEAWKAEGPLLAERRRKDAEDARNAARDQEARMRSLAALHAEIGSVVEAPRR